MFASSALFSHALVPLGFRHPVRPMTRKYLFRLPLPVARIRFAAFTAHSFPSYGSNLCKAPCGEGPQSRLSKAVELPVTVRVKQCQIGEYVLTVFTSGFDVVPVPSGFLGDRLTAERALAFLVRP